jgi:hypothetical protein
MRGLDENGKFAKGNNLGAVKAGKKSKKVQAWEELGKHIEELHTEKFNEFMLSLWQSKIKRDKILAAELYLKVLDYFKPKLSRSTVDNTHDYRQPIVIEKTYIEDATIEES